MTDKSIRFSAEQGLYYRKPYIRRKLVVEVLLGLIAGNVIGGLVFSFHPKILITSLVLAIILILTKKATDGRMDLRNANGDTEITFTQFYIRLAFTFPSDPVETFQSTVCASDKNTHTQTYKISYENIRHVFWHDDSFVMVVNYPCSNTDKETSSGVISPLSFNCPLSFYETLNDAFFSYMREYPQHADLDYIMSYINAIR